MTRLNVGVMGLGRLGAVYAMNLAQRVPRARLAAVADPKPGLAETFAERYGAKAYTSHEELLEDPGIDAVAVITPTSTHPEVVAAAARRNKAIFCEKPISLSLAEAERTLRTVESTGVFFQMGFQRRFDAGYLAAKKKVEEGAIGTPVLLQSTSRDPFRPPLEFCDPKVSGGLISDMGVHDFDVARMFMGEVRSVYATGATLAYPEMKEIGDIDNAVINLTFESGALGAVELSRNAVFGYDIRAEVWGTKGSVQIGYFRQTPILMMTKEGISHDVVPYFMERFEAAYLAQIRDFVDNVLDGRAPAVAGADAVAALRVSVAANLSLKENRPVPLQEIAHASFAKTV
ncbi:MAG: inositol 2-dehydrogenase [Bryobacteraceae bacterium]